MKKLLTFFKNNIIYFLGVFLLLYKFIILELFLGITIRGEAIFNAFIIILFILFPTFNKCTKKSLIYLNIIYFFVTFMMYLNILYYSYSNNFLSFYQIDNLRYSEQIGTSLIYLVNWSKLIIFVTDNIILLFFTIFLFKSKKLQLIEPNKHWYRYIVLAVLLILNIFMAELKLDNVYEDYIYNKTSMVEHLSIYYYHIEDFKDYFYHLIFKEKVDYSKLENAYNNSQSLKKVNSELTGIAKGKNVIIVQLESIGESMIGLEVDGREITPNLNKFFSNSIYFSNMYNQGIGTTADSEHTIITSMYPLENGRVFQKYYHNDWQDIFSVLNNEGYYTSSMHPNVNTFWNRILVYKNSYKVDEYDDIDSFNTNGEMAGEFFSDEQFLLQAVDKIKNYNTPFLSMMISISTHIPYRLDGINNLDEKLTIDASSIESDEIRNYVLSCNFVDYSFGKFMEKLEQTGLLDNSILIVYGDHGAGLIDLQSLEELFRENGKEYNSNIQTLLNVHIPFGIRIPGTKNRVVDKAVAKIDVKPTILNLLGVSDKFSLGVDLFTDKDYAFIKGIGFVTKDYYYINDKYFEKTTNNLIEPNEELLALKEQMDSQLYLSDTIINNNLISYFVK